MDKLFLLIYTSFNIKVKLIQVKIIFRNGRSTVRSWFYDHESLFVPLDGNLLLISIISFFEFNTRINVVQEKYLRENK